MHVSSRIHRAAERECWETGALIDVQERASKQPKQAAGECWRRLLIGPQMGLTRGAGLGQQSRAAAIHHQ
jgi:hypothetical protein